MTRRTRSFLAAGAAFLTLATPAGAEIRTGTVTDPVGDSAGVASQDIVSATAQYDSNGQVVVSATVNGDVVGGPSTFYSFGVKSFAPPTACTGSSVSLFGSSDSTTNYVMVTGVSGVGDAYNVRSGRTITFSGSGNALRDRDYSCMTLSVSRAAADGGGIVDQLNVPLFFDGHGPDGDSDGIKDNRDKCVSEAGPGTVDGCPAKQPEPQPQPQPAQQPQPQQAPPPVVQAAAPVAPKAQANGVPAACQPLTARKRAACIVREKTLAKCKKLKTGKKRSACSRKAKAGYRKAIKK